MVNTQNRKRWVYSHVVGGIVNWFSLWGWGGETGGIGRTRRIDNISLYNKKP